VDLTLDNKNNDDEDNSGTVSHYQTQGQRNVKKTKDWTKSRRQEQKNSPLESITNKDLQPRLSIYKSLKSTNREHNTQSQYDKILPLSVANPAPAIPCILSPIPQSLDQLLQLWTSPELTSFSCTVVQPTPVHTSTRSPYSNKPLYQPSKNGEQRESLLQSLKQLQSKKINKKKSRRTFQRYINRKNKKLKTQKDETELKQKLQPTIRRCLTDFGFYANPEKTIQENFNKAVNNNPSPLFEQPTNLTFHNLCSKNKLPTGTKELLGLNLSFCLAPKQLQNNINHTVCKMAYSIRTRHFLQQNNVNNNQEYIKQL